jgi:hypothetical protein
MECSIRRLAGHDCYWKPQIPPHSPVRSRVQAALVHGSLRFAGRCPRPGDAANARSPSGGQSANGGQRSWPSTNLSWLRQSSRSPNGGGRWARLCRSVVPSSSALSRIASPVLHRPALDGPAFPKEGDGVRLVWRPLVLGPVPRVERLLTTCAVDSPEFGCSFALAVAPRRRAVEELNGVRSEASRVIR